MVTSFGAAIEYTERVPIVIWFCIMGTIALIWQFVLLTNSYTDNISVYYAGNTKELWDDVYAKVIIANWGISLSYVIGSMLLVTQQCRRFNGCFTCNKKGKHQQTCCCCYVNDELKSDKKAIQMFQHEVIYIIFSVVVKSFFVLIVADGRI